MQIATLHKDHSDLVAKEKRLEAEYRDSAIEKWGFDEERVLAKIRRARSSPQKNKQLQAIHEAHMAVLSKRDAIDEAKSRLPTLRKELLNDKVKVLPE